MGGLPVTPLHRGQTPLLLGTSGLEFFELPVCTREG